MNDLSTMTFTLTGLGPMLMHSTRGMDPSDPIVKELRSLTKIHASKKTDEILEEIQRLEFVLGIHCDDKGPFIPAEMLLAAIRDGGKANRKGTEVVRSVLPAEDRYYLEYDGPRAKKAQATVEGLWKDKRFVDVRAAKVGQSRVMRTRPMFPEWKLTGSIFFDQEHLEPGELRRAIETAGARTGIGDYRPRFGRFSVEFA